MVVKNFTVRLDADHWSVAARSLLRLERTHREVLALEKGSRTELDVLALKNSVAAISYVRRRSRGHHPKREEAMNRHAPTGIIILVLLIVCILAALIGGIR